MKHVIYRLILLFAALWAAPVYLTAQTCTAEAGAIQILNCVQVSVPLNGSGTTGPGVTYQWTTTNGNIVSGSTTLSPVVDQPGEYCLLVTDTNNGCTASDCVIVVQDVVPPNADAGPDATLNCIVTVVTLSGSGSAGPEFIYNWNSPNGGLIVSGANIPTPTVNMPGTYCLTVTDSQNGCTSTDCVNVFADWNIPAVSAGPDQTLTCSVTSTTLTANVSGQNMTFLWTGPGINAANQWLLNPQVNLAGTYCVIVTNTVNGCTSTDCVDISLDAVPPLVTASATTMSCSDPQAQLSASAEPPGPAYAFAWSGPFGFAANTPTASSTPGLEAPYTVTVTSATNGCSATATVTPQSDSSLPQVDAAITPVLCGSAFGSITLTPNPPGQQLDIFWSTGATGATIDNLLPGSYVGTITDQISGCSKSVLYAVGNASIDFNVAITPVSCFGAADGAIAVQPLSGTPPYTYEWIGPMGFTTTTSNSTITGLPSGGYNLTITDATGCSGIGLWSNIWIPQPTQMSISIFWIGPDCANNGSIEINTSGGTPPYTYNWAGPNGYTSTATDLFNLQAGPYLLTLTDAIGCTAASQTFVVPAAPAIVVTSLVTNISTCAPGSIILTNGAPNSFLTYLWSDSQTTSGISVNQPGNYGVTVTNESGCTVAYDFQIISVSDPNCTTIEGKVVHDQNENCISDLGDTDLGGWIVQAIGADTFYAVTAANGSYYIAATPGLYNLQVVLPNSLWLACPPVSVTLANLGDEAFADIPVKGIVLCPAMTIDLSTPQLRRCFSNNYYYVNYCNEGPVPATDVYVDLSLDPFLSPNGSSKPYQSLGNDVYRFNLGTVASAHCGTFWVRVIVSCDAVLGQTHCSEAHIYPDTLCVSNANWTGASVLVNAQCEGDSVRFNIKNAGTGPMSNELDYIVIEDGIMLMQADGPPLAAGESVDVVVPANGATWRVEAMQEPFHPEGYLPAAVVEGCAVSGSFSTGFVQQFANPDQGPAVDIDCTVNIGSYDPNDKQGFPIGYGASHYIKPETDIEYLIRFQNTGTDTAFTVAIRDTLSGWLDPATVEPGASSHPYRFDLQGEGVVVFTFDDILLPDSNVNEPASHGFVRFKVAQKAAVPLEEDIFNSAAIYFDFNAPVITNTTYHRVGLNFIDVALKVPEQALNGVRLLPNPLSATGIVELDGWPAGQTLQLSVVNSTGRLMRQSTVTAPRFVFDAGGLPQGMYWLRVDSGDGRRGVLRFVVQ